MAAVSIEQFLDRLAKGKPMPAVLLLGGDVYWRDLCRQKLVEAYLPEGAHAWAVTRFSAANDSFDSILRRAQTLPMLAPRQLVFVEDVESLEKRGEPAREAALAQLERYLDDPAPFTLLVCEAAQLDQRMKLSKILGDQALVVALDLGQEAGAGMTASLARELGVEIDRDAAALLGDLLAGQAARIRIELEKLAAYVGERKRITAADASELVLSAKTYSVWELANVLATGPRGRALEFLDSLLREGEAAPALVGALAWMYRKLLEAQELRGQVTNWQAARQLGMRPETAERVLEQSRKIPREQLCAGLVALAEADNRLKSGAADDRAVMEFLIARLTRSASAPAPTSGAAQARA